MESILNYRITSLIYENQFKSIYQALDSESGEKVILKVVARDSNNPMLDYKLNYEYELLKSVNIKGILKPLSLKETAEHHVLVLEYFDGISFNRYIEKGNMDLEKFFELALELIKVINELHEMRIMHKNICPQVIMINKKGEVRFIDFYSASKLIIQKPQIFNVNNIEYDLYYISPEQTGRINRDIDYTTDFYSLGVLFYKMISGLYPFIGNDKEALILAHVIDRPPAPHRFRADIPQQLSKLILKMLSKYSEERYRSCTQLMLELKSCYSENFPEQTLDLEGLKLDNNYEFIVSQKVYGRDNEINRMKSVLNKIKRDMMQMFIIYGHDGVGKKSLVYELKEDIFRMGGFFIEGKFDEINKSTPYSAFYEILSRLSEEILAMSSEKRAFWKQRILNAVGVNGQIIIDMVPQFEQIIGKQPISPALSNDRSLNRFYEVMEKLIQSFAILDKPLVIFIDDMEWIDRASLKLIKRFALSAALRYILIIGSFNDRELATSHPLFHALEEIEKSKTGIVINRIKLAPVRERDINTFIADCFNCNSKLTHKLTEVIYEKTGGRPFIIKELLYVINEQNLIKGRDDFHSTSRIKKLGDFNEIIKKRILNLPSETLSILKVAGCLGLKFDLNILSKVCKKGQKELYDHLLYAINKNMLTVKVNEGNFLNSVIKEAFYSLLSAQQKDEYHYKVARAIIDSYSSESREDHFLSAVEHLSLAKKLLTVEETNNYIAMNLKAGIKAKEYGSYEKALSYLNVGARLFLYEHDKSESRDSITYFLQIGEVEYLMGNFERAKRFIERVLKKEISLEDKSRAYLIKILIETVSREYSGAFYAGIDILKEYKIDLFNINSENTFEEKMEQMKNIINFEEIIYIPQMKDDSIKMVLKLFIYMSLSANVIMPDVFKTIIIKMVELSLLHGNCHFSSYGYLWFGIFLYYHFDNLEAGHNFGQIALKLLDNISDKDIAGVVYYYYGAILCRINGSHLDELDYLLKSYQLSWESNNIQYACMAITTYCARSFFAGYNLSYCMGDFDKYSFIIEDHRQVKPKSDFNSFRKVVKKLIGSEEDKLSDQGGIEEDDSFIYYFTIMYLSFMSENYLKALEYAMKAEKYQGIVEKNIYLPEFYLYYSLTMFALYQGSDKYEQKVFIYKLNFILNKFESWATKNKSFMDKYLLLKAENARISYNYNEAVSLYDEAVLAARQNNFINMEALINETAAKFYLYRGKNIVAREYVYEAYACYIKWGAIEKAKFIGIKYADILESRLIRISSEVSNARQEIIDNENIFTKLQKYGITNHEYKIAMFIFNGDTNKTIGEKMFISESTVKRHVSNIYKKLELKNRIELIFFIKNL